MKKNGRKVDREKRTKERVFDKKNKQDGGKKRKQYKRKKNAKETILQRSTQKNFTKNNFINFQTLTEANKIFRTIFKKIFPLLVFCSF